MGDYVSEVRRCKRGAVGMLDKSALKTAQTTPQSQTKPALSVAKWLCELA